MAWPRLLLCLLVLLPTLSGCTPWRRFCYAIQGKPDPFWEVNDQLTSRGELPSEDTPQYVVPAWIQPDESSVQR
jgi:hypothetical protein